MVIHQTRVVVFGVVTFFVGVTVVHAAAQPAGFQDHAAPHKVHGLVCDADTGWLSFLSKRAVLRRADMSNITLRRSENTRVLHFSSQDRREDKEFNFSFASKPGDRFVFKGLDENFIQESETTADDSAILYLHRQPNLTEFINPEKVTEDAQAFYMSEFVQGTWAFFILVGLVLVLSFENAATGTGTDHLPRRVATIHGVLWVVQLLVFCQLTLRQPFEFSGVFLMMTGVIFAFQQQDRHRSTVVESCKFSLSQLMRILPLYWIIAAIVLAQNAWKTADDFFNPLLQLFRMPYHHYQSFWALNAWTPVPSSYWFVSTIASFYLMWPIVNLGLQRLGTRRSISSCILVTLLCYVLKVLATIVVMVQPQAVKNRVGHEAAYTRDVGGYKVSFLMNPIARLPDFVMGIMAAHFLDGIAAQEQASRVPNKTLRQGLGYLADLSMTLILSLVIAVRVFDLVPVDGQAVGSLTNVAFLMNLESFMWLAILLGVGCGDANMRPCSNVRRIMLWRPVQVMGMASYAFYLWSVFILQTCGCYYKKEYETCANGDVAVIYAYSMCLAVVSYRFIQEPFFNTFRNMVDTKPDEGIDFLSASVLPNNPIPVSALFANSSLSAASAGKAPERTARSSASQRAASSSGGGYSLDPAASAHTSRPTFSGSREPPFSCGSISGASTSEGRSSGSSSSSSRSASSLPTGASSRATSSLLEAVDE